MGLDSVNTEKRRSQRHAEPIGVKILNHKYLNGTHKFCIR